MSYPKGHESEGPTGPDPGSAYGGPLPADPSSHSHSSDRGSPEMDSAAPHRKGMMSPYYGVRPYGSGGSGYGGYQRGYYYHGGASPGSGFSFGTFSLSRLLRRKWLMMAIFVLVSGATIPWIWVLNQPAFQSTAVVRVSPIVSFLVFRTENNGFLPLYTSYLNTQMAIIRSPKILERVLDQTKVRESFWYKEEGRTLFGRDQDVLGRMIGATSVRRRVGTELIDVLVTAEKAEDAKLLVDTIVDEHKAYVEETLRENESWLVETLMKEQAALQKEIDGLIAMRYNLAKRLGSLDATGVQQQLTNYLNILEAEHRRLQRTLDITHWEIEQLSTTQPAKPQAQGDGTEGDKPGPEAKQDYSDDNERRQLAANLETIENQLEIDLQEYGPEHPRIKRLQATREIAQRLLRERDDELEREWQTRGGPAGAKRGPNRQLALRESAQKTEQEVQLIRDEMDRQRAHLSDISDISLELARYEEAISNKKTLGEAVRKRLEALQFEGKASPAWVQVASHGLKPSSPSGDRRFQMTALTLAAALMLALGAGYVRSSVDKRIYDVAEVQQVYRVPFLGLLPALASTEVPRELGGTLPLTAGSTSYYSHSGYNGYSGGGSDTCQVLMESVRMVRTSLLERMSAEGQRTVLITSAVPRTGKSSVAVLLARSLAMLNKRVLLVEADLRHPTLAGRLNINPKHGLAAVLTGVAQDEEAIIKSEIPNLDVLVAGEIPEDFTTETLANGVFASRMERWKEDYDITLLDSPPILPVADARILAGYADATIMVLRASHDMRNEGTEAYAQLSAAGGKLVGTVFIGGSSSGKSRPYSYGYGYLQHPVTWRWRQRYMYYGYQPRSPQLGDHSKPGEVPPPEPDSEAPRSDRS